MADRPRRPRQDSSRGRRPTGLDRRSWQNWFLIVGVTVFTTFGMGAMGAPPLHAGAGGPDWPWADTDMALLIGLSGGAAPLQVYLTIQQRHLGALPAIGVSRTRDEPPGACAAIATG